MKVILEIFPKKGLYLKASVDQLSYLMDNGLIEEDGDSGLVRLTQSFKLARTDTGAKQLSSFLDEQWLPLWPTEKIQSTSTTTPYHVSGNRKECLRYFKEFVNFTKGKYDFDCVFIATSAYLYDKSQANWQYCQKNYNFVRRELESWCLDYVNNPEESFKKAKLYYEHIRRTATRTRKRRVNVDGFARTAILDPECRRGDSVSTEIVPATGSGHIQPGIPFEAKSGAIRINKSHKG